MDPYVAIAQPVSTIVTIVVGCCWFGIFDDFPSYLDDNVQMSVFKRPFHGY